MGVGDSPVRSALLRALDAFADLVQSDAVRAQWTEPSCLPEYTVGGLAGHTFNTAAVIERSLDAAEPEEPAQPAGSYYAPVPFPDAAPDLHAGVMARAEKRSERGPDALISDLTALSEQLRVRLADEPAERKVNPMGWSVLVLDHYLETRVLELVIHTDDLAQSVGVAVELPADALAITVSHLLGIARERHGDLAVIRAFARRERDTVDAAHVL